jgi:hypothetical protein
VLGEMRDNRLSTAGNPVQTNVGEFYENHDLMDLVLVDGFLTHDLPSHSRCRKESVLRDLVFTALYVNETGPHNREENNLDEVDESYFAESLGPDGCSTVMARALGSRCR